MTTKTLSITETRNNLLNLIRDSKAMLSRTIITKNGKPEAVLMSYDEFEGWIETLEITRDPELMKEIAVAENQIKQGNVVAFEKAFPALKKNKQNGKHK